MIEPEIILGPPGTGKTTSLIQILEEELAAGTEPRRIGYLSFTRRAAEEAISRTARKFERPRTDFPYFRTLHSLCFRLMGLSSSGILDGDQMQKFGDSVGYKITGRFSLDEGTTFGFEKGDRLLFMENLARVRGVPLRQVYEEDHDDLMFDEVDRFARALLAYKQEFGVIDFTDMLRTFVDSEVTVPLDVLLVDEAQDLSLLQWEVVFKLARGVRRLVIAGDDDQAIYRWAGADVETLVRMEGQVRVLSQSYRVPRAVQRVADQIVSRITMRRPKRWSPRDEEGQVIYHRSTDNIDLSGPDILILARNRYVLTEFESQIRSMGYVFTNHDQMSIRQKVLDAVLTWERLRQGRDGVTALQCRKMYEYLSTGRAVKRGHKLLPGFEDDQEVKMQDLVDRGGLLVRPDLVWHDALDRMDMRDIAYIRAARRRGENLTSKPRIRLSTIHGMKGGEADEVILLTDMAARTFEEARRAPDDEARVWYVAVTRARRVLHVVAPRTHRGYKI